MDAHYDAAIWDMDGLLLDSEQISASCWLEASRLVGLSVEPDFFHAVIGMNRGGIEAFLANAVEPDVSTARLIDEATALYIAAIEAGVPLKPGARSCLDWLRDHAIPQGLATSSGHPFATKKLGHHGLVERFGAFVTGDRVSRGKPEPDIFLTASEELQVAPDRCLVFEDSENGARAALAAGMSVVIVPDLALHTDDTTNRALAICSSLVEALGRFPAWFGDRRS